MTTNGTGNNNLQMTQIKWSTQIND